MAGGFGVLIDPSGGAMGVPVDMLRYSPFKDFFIPGLFLFGVLGIGNLLAVFIAWRQWRIAPFVQAGIGIVLVLWIVIQCMMLRSVVFLHVLFFVIGTIQSWLGWKALQRHFAFNQGN